MEASALKPYQQYEKYAREELGIKADDVCVADLPAPLFRGVVATAPIAPDAVVASVPRSATLSVLDADATINELVGLLRMNKVEVEEDEILALILIRERYIKQEGSKWHKHIIHLPNFVDSPLFYTADELESFNGTNFYPIANTLRQQTDKMFTDMHKIIEENGAKLAFPATVFTKKAFTWAIGMVHSRFVSLPVNSRMLKFMVPFFDMFNHSPTALVTHHYDKKSDSVQIVTKQGWNAGEQVCLNYGIVSNMDLLRLHGFLHPLPHDEEHYTLELFVSKKAPGFDKKLKLLNTFTRFCGMPSPALLEELRKKAHAGSGDSVAASKEFTKWKGFVGEMYMIEGGGGGVKITAEIFEGVPHLGLLRALRIIHCAEEDLPDLERVMTVQPDESIGIALEADVLQFLSQALVKQAEALGKREEVETKAVEELHASMAEGAAAMGAITARIQAALEAAGAPVLAPTVVIESDGEDEPVSVLATAAPAKKGKGKDKDKKGKKSKAPATSGPHTLPVVEDAAAVSKGIATPPADAAHKYRLQCAAYFKAHERAILESQLKWITDDIEQLKIIAEHHNQQNAAIAGSTDTA